MRDDYPDNPRWVVYSDAFRGKHAFRGVYRKSKIMTRIATDSIFRRIALDVGMRNGTPRVFMDRFTALAHTSHGQCTKECLGAKHYAPEEYGE